MADSILDLPETYGRLDPEGLIDRISGLPEQFEEAWRAGQALDLPGEYGDVDRIVVLGMGGSGIGGALLRALALHLQAHVPVVSVRGYTLPAYVDARSLVLASSNSGETEETLACFEQALAAGARCIAVTTGGRLRATATERGVPALSFAWAGEPRAALGWSFGALLGICSKAGLLPVLDGALGEALSAMRALGGQITRSVDEPANPAKRLARTLSGRLPVFIGAEVLVPVAYRWRTQVNENAKSWALCDELPEMNHNAQTGFGLPRRVVPLLHAVFLRQESLHPRLRLRIDATVEEMRRAGVTAEVVQVPGRHILQEMLWALYFGDYVSYYLGLLNDVHPSLTPPLSALKRYLAGRPA
ncbi:MAG: bifunctional phosphoglucose/phosphomannose isomerase [Dehalococcoidia bacterium]|nr:bifunctional phosphoglucose/phosphomannose isomerase [Dehalococcoidia bacterium]